jgi:hypothetical protein
MHIKAKYELIGPVRYVLCMYVFSCPNKINCSVTNSVLWHVKERNWRVITRSCTEYWLVKVRAAVVIIDSSRTAPCTSWQCDFCKGNSHNKKSTMKKLRREFTSVMLCLHQGLDLKQTLRVRILLDSCVQFSKEFLIFIRVDGEWVVRHVFWRSTKN